MMEIRISLDIVISIFISVYLYLMSRDCLFISVVFVYKMVLNDATNFEHKKVIKQ